MTTTLTHVLARCSTVMAAALLVFAGSAHAAYPAPFATVHLDVSPGMIQQFSAGLDDADDNGGLGVGMTVQFVKLQASSRWTPLFALCATAQNPVRSECIRFTVDDDTHTLQVESTSRNGDADLVKSPLETLSKLPVDDLFRVSLRVDKKNMLTFAVNGDDVHAPALAFAPKEFSYSCSSLVCDLTLADLADPKAEQPVLTLGRADLEGLQAGRDALMRGDFTVAVDKLTHFIDLVPLFSAPYAQRAQAWLGLGKPDRALADLDEALRIESDPKLNGQLDAVVTALFFLGQTRPDVDALRDRLRAGRGRSEGDPMQPAHQVR